MPPEPAASEHDAARLAAGWREHRAGRLDRALACYREITARDPGNADAWCLVGIALHDTGRALEAVDAYHEALRLVPDAPKVLNNLANSLRVLGRIDESLAALDRAIALDPGYVLAHENRGTTLHVAGRLRDAIAALRHALELEPSSATAHQNLGLLHLTCGDWEAGWPDYEWRTNNLATPGPGFAGRPWAGEPPEGATLMLCAEQGIGDAVHFIRYAAWLKARHRCRILFHGPPRLFPLLATAGSVDGWVEPGTELPRYDYHVPITSVPGRVGLGAGDAGPGGAYLQADAARVERWRARLALDGPGVKVGIVWQGSLAHQSDTLRSVPLIRFGALARLAGVRLYALQAGHGREQLDALIGWLPVTDLAPEIDDGEGAFVDTAAAMRALDLVIAVDTAAAHVAGAIGVPVWVALAHVADWRWGLAGERTPWYDSMRLFRQPTPGDWESVFEAIARAVETTFPGVSRYLPGAHCLARSGHRHLVRARHGWLLANPNDRYIGQSILRYGEFSDAEIRLLAPMVAPGAVVVEGGANIGTHTIGLARRAASRGAVHAFEPQRLAHQALCAAVAMNGLDNVHTHHAALGAVPGKIGVPHLDPARPANFGGVELTREGGTPVTVTSIDALDLRRCDLVVADVEGMELDLLRGGAETIRRFRPLLYLECDRASARDALFSYLAALGYRLFAHAPRLYDPGNFYGNEDNVFGRIVSQNTLAVPSERAFEPRGLAPIVAARDA